MLIASDSQPVRPCVRWRSMKKKPPLIVTVVLTLIGAVFGYAVVETMFQRSNSISFDKSLVEMSKKINATLPMEVDKETRLDATMAGPGRHFTYLYTLPHISEGEVKRTKFVDAMRPQL